MPSPNLNKPSKQKLGWNLEILVQLSLKWGPSAHAFHTWNSMITTAATLFFFITWLLGRAVGTLRREDVCTVWVVILYYYGGWDSLSCSCMCVWERENWINMRNDKLHLSCVSLSSYIGICRWALTAVYCIAHPMTTDALMQSHLYIRGVNGVQNANVMRYSGL